MGVNMKLYSDENVKKSYKKYINSILNRATIIKNNIENIHNKKNIVSWKEVGDLSNIEIKLTTIILLIGKREGV